MSPKKKDLLRIIKELDDKEAAEVSLNRIEKKVKRPNKNSKKLQLGRELIGSKSPELIGYEIATITQVFSFLG